MGLIVLQNLTCLRTGKKKEEKAKLKKPNFSRGKQKASSIGLFHLRLATPRGAKFNLEDQRSRKNDPH